MATAFETRMLSTADRLIRKFGRKMVLTTKGASKLRDSDKPWRGTTEDETKNDVYGVILPIIEGKRLGTGLEFVDEELVQKSDEAGYVVGGCPKIRNGDVLDGRTVLGVKEYDPGNESLLYELWLRR